MRYALFTAKRGINAYRDVPVMIRFEGALILEKVGCPNIEK